MLKVRMILIGALVAFSVTLWGCAGDLPQAQRQDILDLHQGESFESAFLSQVLNPEAGEPAPVVGLDGRAAANNMNKYRKMLKKEVKVRPTVGVGLKVRRLRGGD
jgi:hypothetical protein